MARAHPACASVALDRVRMERLPRGPAHASNYASNSPFRAVARGARLRRRRNHAGTSVDYLWHARNPALDCRRSGVPDPDVCHALRRGQPTAFDWTLPALAVEAL